MARPTKPASVKLSKLLQFRVSEAEQLQFQANAAASGMSEADFGRSLLLNSKPRRKKVDPDRQAKIAALGALGQLRAIGNQIVKDRLGKKYVPLEQVVQFFEKTDATYDTILKTLSDGD